MSILRPRSSFRGACVIVLAMVGVLLASPAEGQNARYDVNGVVADTAGTRLSGAMVVALTRADSVLKTFSTTDGNGAFKLSRLPAGEYILQVSLTGFQTSRKDFAVTGSNVDAGEVTLNVMAFELDPLVVSADHVPFLNRRDTLEYNALAFVTRPNATVEDLLRRLPGIQVEADGSIKAQGEDVQKVLVDGKEFFGNDPTIATRNLPADAIQRVQVYDKQSDMAEFTGIADGQEARTIDLKLKEGAKHGYFGGAAGGLGAGVGSSGPLEAPGNARARYDETFSINRFSPTTQLAGIGNINNVNRPGFSWADYMSFVGGAKGLAAEGGRGGGGVQVGGGRDDGFTETLALGLNASHDFAAGSWLRSSYFLSRLDNRQRRATEQQQLLGSNIASFSNQTSDQTTDNLSHHLNLNAQHTFAKGHDLRLRADVTASSSSLESSGSQETRTASGQPQNTASSNYFVQGDDLRGSARLTWRKRLGEDGRSLVAEASANLSEPDLDGDLATTTGVYERGDVVTYDEVVQAQSRMGRTVSQSQRLSLIEPLGSGRVLEIFGERSAVDEDQDKTVHDIENGTRIFNELLSTGFERTYSYLRGGMRFSRNTENTRLVLGLQLQGSDLDGRVLDRDGTITSGYTHILPSANYRIQFKEGRNLDLNYRMYTREPSLNELQPFVDNSDPLNVYAGNPNLVPEVSHGLNAEYKLFDQFSFMNLFTFVRLVYTKDAIAMSRTVDTQAVQQITPVNSDGRWSLNSGVNFGTPIRRIGAKLGLNYNLTYSTGSEFVNQVENVSRILRNTIDARLENRAKDVFDVRAGARLTFNNADYSLNDALNQDFINRTLYASGRYYVREDWTFDASLDYRVLDQDVFGPGQNVALLGASVSRLVMEGRGEIELSAFDLLDQNRGIDITTSSSAIRREQVESLGQFLMLKFTYRLRPGSRDGKAVAADKK